MSAEEDRERIEQRYHERLKNIESWRVAQQAALDAEVYSRHLTLLHERDRDFQAHGLPRDGRQRTVAELLVDSDNALGEA